MTNIVEDNTCIALVFLTKLLKPIKLSDKVIQCGVGYKMDVHFWQAQYLMAIITENFTVVHCIINFYLALVVFICYNDRKSILLYV